MKNKEIRFFKTDEFRAVKKDDGTTVLEGYSAVFDRESDNLGWGDWEVREIIKPGAFTEALKKSDCRALFNHNSNFVLGRESAKTLKIIQDDKGLRSIINLPDTSVGRDLAVSVERGDIREQSFGFTVIKDQWEEDKVNKKTTRTILEVGELYDISPVTYPAYPDTTIAKRSLEEFRAATSANTEPQPEIETPDLANKAEIDSKNVELDKEIIDFLF